MGQREGISHFFFQGTKGYYITVIFIKVWNFSLNIRILSTNNINKNNIVLLREDTHKKKVVFLVVGPLRGGGGKPPETLM